MSPLPGWGSWSLNPVIALLLIAAVVVYARMYRRAGQNAAQPPGAGHWMAYGAGILTLVAALFSPLDQIGDHYLLSAHMTQHVLLSDIAPALLVLGLRSPVVPLGLSRRALRAVAPGARSASGRVLATVTSPWVALPLWAVATVVVGAAEHVRLRRCTPARARTRARHAVLHRARAVVADRRSAARGAPAPQRPASGHAGLHPRRQRAGVCPADLVVEHRIRALRRGAARLRPVGDRRPAAGRREHVLRGDSRVRDRLRGRLPRHAGPLRGAHGARRGRRRAGTGEQF